MKSVCPDKRLRCFAALLVLVSLPVVSATAAEAELTPHSAVYKVKISVLSGELTTRLSKAGDRYVAVHRVAPTGMARMLVNGTIEETSGFALTSEGVRPLHYSSLDTVDDSQAEFEFDWANQAISGQIDGESVTMAFDGTALDRVSIQYAMMRDMLAGDTDKDYLLFDIDEFKELNITMLGTREIDVPAGRYEAVGIQHQAKGSSRVTTLWCVPALDFLPAIIEQHRKGKLNLRATLAEYQADEKPLSASGSLKGQ